MGSNHSTRKASYDANGEVNFDHFQILRAIGKGSFGKVCIVQKKDSKKMFAMKYMNKPLIIKKDAIRNVFREIDLLRSLEHPFIVNLWFTFQDEEDMFMVVDLLLGGDLRYHIQQDVKFDEKHVKLYICEIALALDYLQGRKILHRDIKPDNVLLDEEGHVHITDFNIATTLKEGGLASSMSGTKPYMAPEVFATALEKVPGYSYPFDWWSTGVCAYEMLRGRRPYEIHSNTSVSDVHNMFLKTGVHYPSSWDVGMTDLLKDLMVIDPAKRLSTFDALKQHPYLEDVDFERVIKREMKPKFVPAKDHLNCDPTFELEEMIIEAKPLHKKKKRLAKQNTRKNKETDKENQPPDPMQVSLDNINRDFKPYNRERELVELEEKRQKEELEDSQPQPTENGETAPTLVDSTVAVKDSTETEPSGQEPMGSKTEPNGTKLFGSKSESSGLEPVNGKTESSGLEPVNSKTESSGPKRVNSKTESTGPQLVNSHTDSTGQEPVSRNKESIGPTPVDSQSESTGPKPVGQ